MRGIFKRLIRDNAQSLDRPGVDDVAPADVHDELYRIYATGVAMSTHGRGTTQFHGSLESPVSQSPPRSLGIDSPPLLIDSHYARSRRGEGSWGLEPLVPEGETI